MSIHVGDTGTSLQFTVANNGVAVNVTGMTLQLVFTRPDGTQLTVTPTVVNAVAGIIQYTTQPGDINLPGYWQYTVIVSSGSAIQWSSDIGNFVVLSNTSPRWQIEMSLILRGMIYDFSSPPIYPDTRLQQLILVSAQFIQQELDYFQQNYIIDIVNNTITPDPTVTANGFTRDDAFINLTLAKTACLIDTAEARLATAKGVMLMDRGMQIDLRSVAQTKVQIWQKGWCQNYKDAKMEYMMGNTGAAGMGIIGPFREEVNYPPGPWTPDGFGSPLGGGPLYNGVMGGQALMNDGRFR